MWAPASNVPDGEAQQLLSELSGELMSPFCPGRTIASCPSSQARKLEERILADAKQGKTREEIEQTLVADYGTEIIGYRPPNSLLITTIVGGSLALAALVMLGRKWVGRGKPEGAGVSGAGAPSGPSVAELDALEDALDDEEGF